MKIIIVLIAVLPVFTAARAQSPPGTQTQSPVNSLIGLVSDSADGKPLAGVSIFLNSTSKGTVSHEDGSFLLKGIPRGQYDLVVSAIGYETFVITINGSRLPHALKIVLHAKAAELAAVTVEPYLKNGWQQWGRFFLDNFIGTIENANHCHIKNRSILRFHFYKKSNRLSVTAAEPLIIENDALGYDLQYKLEAFVSDFNSHVITYYGYPYFREMSTTSESRRLRWEQHRQIAYQGSMMNFMRSLYAGHAPEEGFTLQQQVSVPNQEKRRVQAIYHPDTQPADTFPIDTLHHFWEVLRQPDHFSQTITVPPDSLVNANADQTRSLFFSGTLTVLYKDEKQKIDQGSRLKLITPALVRFEENGNYYPPQEVLTTGFWGQTEKIANLLPLDYGQP